jgi:ParB family chromosome partitioning protein
METIEDEGKGMQGPVKAPAEKRRRAALDGKRLNAFAMDPLDLVIIGLDTEDGPEHYLWDERVKLALDEPLTRNIMVHGVIHNVTVAKDGDRVLVVAGRQRVRSAREANVRLEREGKMPILVPVTVRRGEDADLAGVFASENENRRADTPLAKAQKAQRLLNMGRSEDQVAIDMGLKTPHLKQLLKLMELAPKVRKAINADRLSASAALELHGLPRDKQEAKLDGLLAAPAANGKKVTAKDAKRSKDVIVPPSKRQLRALSEVMKPPHSMLLAWILGEITEQALLEECAVLRPAFEKIKKG